MHNNFLDKMSEVELIRDGVLNSRRTFLQLRYMKMEKYHGVHTITCEHLNSVEATMILEMVKDSPGVEELSLTGDDLSTEQLTSIITAATKSDKLESLNLSRN